MFDLLKLNLNRLKKSSVFWIIFIIIVIFPFLLFFSQYNDRNTIFMEEDLFIIMYFIGIAISIFTSLFVGTDFSDGTIRNKIIIGKRRVIIYFSNLITSVFVGLIYFLLYFFIFTIVGNFLFSSLNIPSEVLLYLFFDCIFIIAVLSSIFTFISMLIPNKTYSAVASILLIFWLIVFGAIIQQKLISATGFEKEIYQFLYDILPTGQGLQIASLKAINYKIFPIYSFLLMLMINFLGILKFNKKELK